MSDTVYDHDAERALLGACLLSESATERATAIVSPDDLSAPKWRNLFAALATHAATSSGPVDIVTLAADTGIELADLHELQNSAYSVSNVHRYAERIATAANRAKVVETLGNLVTRAQQPDSDPVEVAEAGRAALARIDTPAAVGPPDPDIDSFIASIPTEHDWLVPDVLERGDRMLVTASEGAGKSVLLAQFGVQTACGIHPWTRDDMAPRNVLVVDLENPERLLGRRFADLRKIAGDALNPQRLRIHSRPEGLDLSQRTDRRWLLDRCHANAAELLVIGPAYRLASGVAQKGDAGAEDQTKRVTAALDDIRARTGVALLMETHAPHGGAGYGRDLRPFGSSVWLRWPEFGIGIRRDDPDSDKSFSLEHWRGPRDQRLWPRKLVRGGRWPWTPEGMPTGTFR